MTSNQGEGTGAQSVFTNFKSKETKKVNVRCPTDWRAAWITGCAFLPDGRVVLCDNNNRKVKIFDKSFTLEGSLDLPSGPWDVSVVSATTIVVTLPEIQQLLYTEVVPSIKEGRVIQLDQWCYGVEATDGDIYVTCHSEHMHCGDGEVRVLDQDGNVKKRLGANSDGSFIFRRPDYVAVNIRSNKIYISDAEEQSVTCIVLGETPESKPVYWYKDSALKWTSGVCVDDEDNILVCGVDSHNVHVLSAAGEKHSVILSSRDAIEKPCSIAYRREDGTMVIGFPDDELLVCNFVNI